MTTFFYTYFVRLTEVLSWILVFLIYSYISGLSEYGKIVYPLFVVTMSLSFVTAFNTIIIKEVKEESEASVLVYYVALLVISLIFIGVVILRDLSIFIFVYFVLSGIRNIEYSVFRALGHTRTLSVNSLFVNIFGIGLLFFTKNYVHFFMVLSIIKLTEIVSLKFTMRSYQSISRTSNFNFTFLKKNALNYLFLLLPLFIAPLDKGLIVNVINDEALGFYQLNDQFNTGIYTLIMSVLYVKLPDIFSMIQNVESRLKIISNLFLLQLLPFVFISIDLVIWLFYPHELGFYEMIIPILISSFYKSFLAFVALFTTVFLVVNNGYQYVMIIMLLSGILLATIFYIENFNIALILLIFSIVIFSVYKLLLALLKTI